MKKKSEQPALPVSEMADIETASEDYASRFAGDVGAYFLEVQARLTLHLLRDLPHAAVLDVGGGHAQLTNPLIENGYDVTVTGSTAVCQERLKRLCDRGRCKFLTCDYLNLPFEDNSFDVVMSFRLLPHTVHWRRLVEEMCRVAGKTVIIDYPDRRSANILYDLFFEFKKKMEGNTREYTLFTRRDLTEALQANNFGPPLFKPEFLMPMVLHRKINSGTFSRMVEALAGFLGLTRVLGSPVILRSDKKH